VTEQNIENTFPQSSFPFCLLYNTSNLY